MVAVIGWFCCLLALVPAGLMARNLSVFRPPSGAVAPGTRVSVLIPARNEAVRIAAAIDSVLQSTDVDFELIVLDDDSDDGTAEVVATFAATDSRVRLLQGGAVTQPGICGKPYACQRLAAAARGDILIFMDADVRLAPDALNRLTAAMQHSPAALLSGIPRQAVSGFLQHQLIPLIHFIMLAFLPIDLMRRDTSPAFGAACGQLLVVRQDAYAASGGHAAILTRVHDAIALSRQLRAHGYLTDLVDISELAHCRMYAGNADALGGFLKNAHEGLGSPAGILPWTMILLTGQVVPWGLMIAAWRTGDGLLPAVLASSVSFLARIGLQRRFQLSWTGALSHPLGVLILVSIQWLALLRRCLGGTSTWKGRTLP